MLARVEDRGRMYTTGYTPIEYDHITPERMYRAADVRIQSVNVALPHGLNVGYVQGVGDNVAPTLRDLGIPVTLIDPATLPVTDLSHYSTIVVGPRAYQADADVDRQQRISTDVRSQRRYNARTIWPRGDAAGGGHALLHCTCAAGRACDGRETRLSLFWTLTPTFLNTPNRITAGRFRQMGAGASYLHAEHF